MKRLQYYIWIQQNFCEQKYHFVFPQLKNTDDFFFFLTLQIVLVLPNIKMNPHGAIAVHTVSSNLVPSLLGLCMIDVVEGTAMDALNSMQNFLHGRPKTFKSLENAIEWR